MTVQIVLQRRSHCCTLSHEPYALGGIFPDFFYKNGIVCATQDYRVNLGVVREQIVYVAFHKVVGAIASILICLDKRYPHRARLAGHFNLGEEFAYLKRIRE